MQEFLTIKNYKEPLKKIPKEEGFGYYGTICATTDGTKLQCHICGELFDSLSLHIFQAHKISTGEYKDKFQLARQTALVSESRREKRKQVSLAWVEKQKNKYGENWRYEVCFKPKKTYDRKKIKHYKGTLETKNKRGTCPDQLLSKIHEVEKKLGRTPSFVEFMNETGGQRYSSLIVRTFGTWIQALKMAKLQPKERIAKSVKTRYTDEELLEYLVNFARENQSVPTWSDFNRGLLPTFGIYTKRFGSIEKARELAGVYDFVPRKTSSSDNDKVI